MMFKKKLYSSALIIFLVVVSCNCFAQITVVQYSLRSEKLAGGEFDPSKLKFELIFNSKKAICKFVNVMTVNEDDDPMFIGPMNDSHIIYYSDLDTQQRIANTEFSGNYFNVLLNNITFKWDITTESRIINNFKCYKATTEYQIISKVRNTVKTYRPIVWFTPEVPTSFGFQKLNGLPGLMIEGTINGYTYFYVTSIEHNVKNLVIDKPKAPIEMTENEWEARIATMSEERKSVFKN